METSGKNLESSPGRANRVAAISLALGVLGLNLWAAVTQTAPEVAPLYQLEAIAGSYGPFGENQVLTIDSLGNVSYHRSEIGSPNRDSIFTTLSASARQALYDTLIAANFLGLNSLYESTAMDGSGIVIRYTSGLTVKTVQSKNLAVSGVNRVARTVNTLLTPAGITLRYDTIND